MTFFESLPYIAVMAVTTYLIRMIPLTFFTRKITNPFLLSFLHYIPYAVLSAMTFPAILSATGNTYSALAGLLAGFLMAYLEKSLIVVAASACGAALLAELILSHLIS